MKGLLILAAIAPLLFCYGRVVGYDNGYVQGHSTGLADGYDSGKAAADLQHAVSDQILIGMGICKYGQVVCHAR